MDKLCLKKKHLYLNLVNQIKMPKSQDSGSLIPKYHKKTGIESENNNAQSAVNWIYCQRCKFGSSAPLVMTRTIINQKGLLMIFFNAFDDDFLKDGYKKVFNGEFLPDFDDDTFKQNTPWDRRKHEKKDPFEGMTGHIFRRHSEREKKLKQLYGNDGMNYDPSNEVDKLMSLPLRHGAYQREIRKRKNNERQYRRLQKKPRPYTQEQQRFLDRFNRQDSYGRARLTPEYKQWRRNIASTDKLYADYIKALPQQRRSRILAHLQSEDQGLWEDAKDWFDSDKKYNEHLIDKIRWNLPQRVKERLNRVARMQGWIDEQNHAIPRDPLRDKYNLD